MTRTPSEIAAHAAGAHAYAAGLWRVSDSAAQRAFAPVLDTWAANARSRADAPAGQMELFRMEIE